jgi:hypothetical protein
MKRMMIAVVTLPLMANPVFAQAAATPTPSLAVTSPLGMVPSAPVGGMGLPLGATEIASPGISPLLTGTVGSTGCSTIGAAPSTMFGSTATFDGGGTSVGSTAPATMAASSSMAMSGTSDPSSQSTTSPMVDTSGLSATCGSGLSGLTASSTSPLSAGGGSRTGIPPGSTEISNLGVSPALVAPTIVVSPQSLTPSIMPSAMPGTVNNN